MKSGQIRTAANHLYIWFAANWRQTICKLNFLTRYLFFENQIVGDFRADLFIDDTIIIEIKAVETLHPRHEVQLVNYLRATNIEIGLLINFGNSFDVKRKIFTNDRKK